MQSPKFSSHSEIGSMLTTVKSSHILQFLMDCFSVACDDFGLAISLKKTVAMYEPAPSKMYVPNSVYVNRKKLEVIDTLQTWEVHSQ